MVINAIEGFPGGTNGKTKQNKKSPWLRIAQCHGEKWSGRGARQWSENRSGLQFYVEWPGKASVRKVTFEQRPEGGAGVRGRRS